MNNAEPLVPDRASLATLQHDYETFLKALPGRSRSTLDEKTRDAVISSVSLGPAALGIEGPAPTFGEGLEPALRAAEAGNLLEAPVCLHWVRCVTGQTSESSTFDAALASHRLLWAPVRALVYRILGQAGRRADIGALQFACDPGSLIEVDAWLEGCISTGLPGDWRNRVENAGATFLPEQVRGIYQQLLLAEGAVAAGDYAPALDMVLRDLAQVKSEALSASLAGVESARLASRAAAALVRLRLGTGSELWDVLRWESFQGLPLWEKMFLRGLIEWRGGNISDARRILFDALQINSDQNCTRLALASLLSSQNPVEALAMLEEATLSFDVLVSRAALLARLGRYDDAEVTLGRRENNEGRLREPLRYSWSQAREDRRRQAHLLAASLAERRSHWHVARQELHSLEQLLTRKTLIEARKAFLAWGEIRQLPSGQQWPREQGERRLKSHLQALSAVSLNGDELFYRAMTQSNLFPDQALDGLRALLKQAGWVSAQKRVGGARLLAIGDALMCLGEAADASRSYVMAGVDGTAVAERQAVASTAAAFMAKPAASGLAEAVVPPMSPLPGNASNKWVQALSALGLAAAGQFDACKSQVAKARALGIPWEISCSLDCLCGKPGICAGNQPESSGVRADILALADLFDESEALPLRAARFIGRFGKCWRDRCPTNPEMIAAAQISFLCAESRWDEALSWTSDLTQQGLVWASRLLYQVRLRQAVALANHGSHDQAVSMIRELLAQR